MYSCVNGNLVGSLSIGQGERGKSIEYMWRGTELGIRQEGETEYQFVDLAPKDEVINGREVELQVGNGYIQWRYKGEDEWKNLIAIADLKGEKGDKGDNGNDGRDGENGKSLEFEWKGTELGIKREDSNEFQYTNLKGADGVDGKDGKDGITPNLTVGNVETLEPTSDVTVTIGGTKENPILNFGIPKGEKGNDGVIGKDGKSLEFNWDDTSLGIRVQGDSDYQYVNLKGQQGQRGEQGTKGDKGETGEKGQKGDKGDQGIQGLQGEKGEQGERGEKGDQGDNGVFVGDVNEAPESANIVVDESDEGLILFPDMTEFEEEIKKARTDYFGTTHEDLQQRLNNDFDNIHQKVNDSSLLPYEGANITAKDSYYGLIKDLSIKGRTLQNLVPDITKLNDGGSGVADVIKYTNGFKFTVTKSGSFVISSKEGDVFNLKSNTKYTAIVNIKSNTLNSALTVYKSPSSVALFTVRDLGISKVVFDTGDLTNYTRISIGLVGEYAVDTSIEVINFMILEGDYGNTPLSDLPFIEGIKSVGENEVTEDGKYKISAKVCGKNLFGGELEIGGLLSQNGDTQISNTAIRCKDFIYVPATFRNKSFKLTTNIPTFNIGIGTVICFYDYNKNYITGDNHNSLKIVPYNACYIKFRVRKVDDSVITADELSAIRIQIEEGTVTTDYEPYKEQLVEYLLDEPLRSLPNGVKDEIVDGELIRRVGKKVLNGENFTPTKSTTAIQSEWRWKVYSGSNVKNVSSAVSNTMMCDRFTVVKSGQTWSEEFKEGICQNNSGGVLYLYLKKYSDGSDSSRDLLVQELKANPVTVCYELETPVETQLEKQILFSQDNVTHITSDNLLPPKVSCKIPSNVPAIVSSLRLENEELQKENTTLTEKIEANNINNIETSLEQDARLTMLELGVY